MRKLGQSVCSYHQIDLDGISKGEDIITENMSRHKSNLIRITDKICYLGNNPNVIEIVEKENKIHHYVDSKSKIGYCTNYNISNLNISKKFTDLNCNIPEFALKQHTLHNFKLKNGEKIKYDIEDKIKEVNQDDIIQLSFSTKHGNVASNASCRIDRSPNEYSEIYFDGLNQPFQKQLIRSANYIVNNCNIEPLS